MREGAKSGGFGKVSKMVVDVNAAHLRAAHHLAADGDGEPVDLRGKLALAEVWPLEFDHFNFTCRSQSKLSESLLMLRQLALAEVCDGHWIRKVTIARHESREKGLYGFVKL